MRNGEAVPLESVPLVPFDEFRGRVVARTAAGARLLALFAHAGRFHAVLGDEEAGTLEALRTEARGAYPALTPDCPQAHLFERELREQAGATPEGHPWLKPVRGPIRDFFRVEGDEVHEVAVGPIHAGVIEPGHFRFQCHGEDVLHLEIALGYQHRGAEEALTGGPGKRSIHHAETLCGDSSVAHATAWCQALEALGGTRAGARALALRGVALELERLANHAGDLGALAGDAGYLPTAAFCGRVRGDFLNATAALCGSRFGRGLVRPGGVRFDAGPELVADLLDRLARAGRDAAGAIGLLWDSNSVMARFEGTGVVSRADAAALGLVGPAARACGLERDARRDFPQGIYAYAQVPVSTAPTGDVLARAFVRWLEIQRSLVFAREQLESLPAGPARAPLGPLAPDRLVVSLVEGWRGEVCHVLLTGPDGRLARVKVVDPSFRNWSALALAMRGQPISDFPLCNKSFNLSYCGHDL